MALEQKKAPPSQDGGAFIEEYRSDIEIGDAERVVLDEFATGFDFISHQAGEEAVGNLGVVGPTRMDYPGTMAAVRAVARYVSRILDEA